MKRITLLCFNALVLAAALVAGPAHAVTSSADIFNAKQSLQNTAQASTPATPPTGSGKLYFKTDGLLYMLDDAGTETQIQPVLPSSDATAVVKGSADATKLLRFEIDGFTTGVTRVITWPDQNLDLGANQTKLDGIETAADVTDATNVDNAGAVMESDYNANTILKADSDNTPTVLQVDEQEILCRPQSGSIDGCTAAQIKVILALTNVQDIKVNLNAAGAPSVTDDDVAGYAVGSQWVDVSNDKVYNCVDSSTGAAVWVDITAGASGGDPDQNLFQTITTDTGTDSAADTTTDTLVLSGGTGIRTDSDGTTDTITISACDDDGDTCLKTEESADEDVIRFDTAGTQRGMFDANGLSLAAGESVNEFSADEALAGNSDDAVPTEQAVKAYVDNQTDRNQTNIINTAYRMAQATGLACIRQVDGFVDAFADETCVDTGGSTNQLYNSTSDFYYAGAGTASDTFTATLDADNVGNDNDSHRQVIPASAISTNGDFVRITLEAAATGDGLKMDNVAIVERSGSTASGTTVPTEILFSGTSGTGTVTAGNTIVSDWLEYSIDETKDYLIVMDWSTDSANDAARIITSAGSTLYRRTDFNSYNISSGSGFSTIGSSHYFAVNKIEVAGHGDLTVQANSQTASAQPTEAHLVVFQEDVAAATENTDFKGWASRDGGTTWTQVTLTDQGAGFGSQRILDGRADISGQPAGTSMKWRVTTHNAKEQRIHGVGLEWD